MSRLPGFELFGLRTMSRIIDLADSLVESLNAVVFDPPFIATRTYRVTLDLTQMTDLQVNVVPKAIDISALSRATNQRDIQIDVGVQKKLTGVSQGDMDPLMDLVEAIEKHVRDTLIFDPGNARWIATQNIPVFSQEHLAESRMFTSVLTFTFKTVG